MDFKKIKCAVSHLPFLLLMFKLPRFDQWEAGGLFFLPGHTVVLTEIGVLL
jgi:hypothetical protein